MKTNMRNTYSEPERLHEYYEITDCITINIHGKEFSPPSINIQGNVQRFILKMIIIFEESNQIQ